MPSTQEVRRRLRSVKKKAQINKAKQIEGSIKMRRAQERAGEGRPHTQTRSARRAHLCHQPKKFGDAYVPSKIRHRLPRPCKWWQVVRCDERRSASNRHAPTPSRFERSSPVLPMPREMTSVKG